MYAQPRFRSGAIRDLCESRGLSQAAIARLCGVSRQVVNLWVRKRCQPQFQTILLLCSKLGVDPEFFAEGLERKATV